MTPSPLGTPESLLITPGEAAVGPGRPRLTRLIPQDVKEAAIKDYLSHKETTSIRKIAAKYGMGWMTLFHYLKNIALILPSEAGKWREYPDRVQKLMIETDLIFLARDVLGYSYNPVTKEGICNPPDEVHLQMAEDIQRQERYKLLFYSRFTYKTTIFIVANDIQIMCKNPEYTIIVASDPIDKAKAILLEICQHLEGNEDLIRLYGVFKPKERGYWNKKWIYVNQRKRPYSKQPSIMVAGLKTDMTGKHPNEFQIDDIVHPKNMTTPEQQQKVVDFIDETIHLTGRNGKLTMDGTPYACDDPWSRTKKKFEKIVDGTSGGELLAQGEENLFFFRKTGISKEDGTTVMPHKYTPSYVKLLKQITPANVYAAQYECDPMAGENVLIKPYDLEHCQYDNFDWIANPDPDIFIMIDPGSALSSKKCYTGIVLGILVPPYDLWIDYAIRLRAEPSHIVDKIMDIVGNTKYRRKIRIVGVEAVSFQKIYKGSLFNAFMKAGYDISVMPLVPDDSKDNRIYNMEPYFRHGQIHVQRQLEDFLYQVGHYPHIADYNRDLLDALAYFPQALKERWIVNPEGIIVPSDPVEEKKPYIPPESLAGFDDEEMLAGVGREW